MNPLGPKFSLINNADFRPVRSKHTHLQLVGAELQLMANAIKAVNTRLLDHMMTFESCKK